MRDEGRENGPRGRIVFGISVRMNRNLKEHIERLSKTAWKAYREESGMVSECADILARSRGKELLAEGSEARSFAVASNQWEWEAVRLLKWRREIEALHDVLKNDLVAGGMPCGRFGANAAWLRLAAMPHNVMTALKRIALPVRTD